MKESSSTVLRRIGKNVTILFSGAVVIGLLGLGTLTLNARALGPTQFGLLVLVQSFVVICGRVFSFDTWQAVIKFGSEFQARRDVDGLRAIGSFAFVFDASSAIAAGTVGLLLLFFFPRLIGLPETEFAAAAVYTATLFIQLPGAPIGVLRLYDKFHWLTAITVGEAAARLAASGVMFMLHAPLSAYLYSFAAILVAANGARVAASMVLLRSATGSLQFSRIADLRRVSRQFLRFSSGSWITGTLNVTRRDGTTLIIAALLGPAGAGLYGVAVRLVRPIRDLAELLRQAIFPDLSRLIADGNHASLAQVVRRILLRTVPLAVAITLGGILAGDIALRTIVGVEYADAYWPLVFLVAASGVYLCMPLLSSLVILYAGMRRYTVATAAAAAIWAALFVWPVLTWGVAGAGVGELVYVVAWAALNILALVRSGPRLAERAPDADRRSADV